MIVPVSTVSSTALQCSSRHYHRTVVTHSTCGSQARARKVYEMLGLPLEIKFGPSRTYKKMRDLAIEISLTMISFLLYRLYVNHDASKHIFYIIIKKSPSRICFQIHCAVHFSSSIPWCFLACRKHIRRHCHSHCLVTVCRFISDQWQFI